MADVDIKLQGLPAKAWVLKDLLPPTDGLTPRSHTLVYTNSATPFYYNFFFKARWSRVGALGPC